MQSWDSFNGIGIGTMITNYLNTKLWDVIMYPCIYVNCRMAVNGTFSKAWRIPHCLNWISITAEIYAHMSVGMTMERMTLTFWITLLRNIVTVAQQSDNSMCSMYPHSYPTTPPPYHCTHNTHPRGHIHTHLQGWQPLWNKSFWRFCLHSSVIHSLKW